MDIHSYVQIDRGGVREKPASELLLMQSQAARIDAALDARRRAQFGMTDAMRRLQGNALGALGLSPNECPFQIIASGPFWRLREYGGKGTKRPMAVAAPLKRLYICDFSH